MNNFLFINIYYIRITYIEISYSYIKYLFDYTQAKHYNVFHLYNFWVREYKIIPLLHSWLITYNLIDNLCSCSQMIHSKKYVPVKSNVEIFLSSQIKQIQHRSHKIFENKSFSMIKLHIYSNKLLSSFKKSNSKYCIGLCNIYVENHFCLLISYFTLFRRNLSDNIFDRLIFLVKLKLANKEIFIRFIIFYHFNDNFLFINFNIPFNTFCVQSPYN